MIHIIYFTQTSDGTTGWCLFASQVIDQQRSPGRFTRPAGVAYLFKCFLPYQNLCALIASDNRMVYDPTLKALGFIVAKKARKIRSISIGVN